MCIGGSTQIWRAGGRCQRQQTGCHWRECAQHSAVGWHQPCCAPPELAGRQSWDASAAKTEQLLTGMQRLVAVLCASQRETCAVDHSGLGGLCSEPLAGSCRLTAAGSLPSGLGLRVWQAAVRLTLWTIALNRLYEQSRPASNVACLLHRNLKLTTSRKHSPARCRRGQQVVCPPGR